MERLTERNPLWIDDEMWERACEPDCEEIDAVYRKLKDYEDAEEQGRMIIFPCNKGDKIYEFYRECAECRLEAGETPEDIISMRRVRYFGYDGDEAYIYASQALPVRLFNNDEPFCIPVSEIGKTVFLSYEKAEAKLKELRGKKMDKFIESVSKCDFDRRISEVVEMLEEKQLYGTISLIKDLKYYLDLATKEKAHTCSCQHNSNSRDDEPCCRCDSKQTNADRIRNMPGEELADTLFNSCLEVMHIDECPYAYNAGKCKKCLLDWLQSEAE